MDEWPLQYDWPMRGRMTILIESPPQNGRSTSPATVQAKPGRGNRTRVAGTNAIHNPFDQIDKVVRGGRDQSTPKWQPRPSKLARPEVEVTTRGP